MSFIRNEKTVTARFTLSPPSVLSSSAMTRDIEITLICVFIKSKKNKKTKTKTLVRLS